MTDVNACKIYSLILKPLFLEYLQEMDSHSWYRITQMAKHSPCLQRTQSINFLLYYYVIIIISFFSLHILPLDFHRYENIILELHVVISSTGR